MCAIMVVDAVIWIETDEFNSFVKILADSAVGIFKGVFHHKDGRTHIDTKAVFFDHIATTTRPLLFFQYCDLKTLMLQTERCSQPPHPSTNNDNSLHQPIHF